MVEPRRTGPDSNERLAWNIAEFASRPGVYAMAAFGDAALPNDVDERRVQFGADSLQCLVFCMPRHPEVEGFVYLLHGGGWRSGDADSYRFMARFLAARGIPAAVGGYRHAPEHHFPAQLEDGLAGFRAACETASSFGLVAGRAVFGGQSAGAHIAALAAAEGRPTRIESGCGTALAGLLLISGPLDLNVTCGDGICWLVEELMGCGRDASWNDADPVRHISADDRFRVLAFHGRHDPLVPFSASESYVARTNNFRPGSAELVVVDSAHHADLIRMFLGEGSPESATMIDWLRLVLGVGVSPSVE